MIAPAQTRLAIYGSLGRGGSNHHEVADLRGRWITGTVRGRLLASGWGAAEGYPGLILDPGGDLVPVELLISADLPAHWSRLDAFEGEEYRRVVTGVDTPEGPLDACLYELAPAPD